MKHGLQIILFLVLLSYPGVYAQIPEQIQQAYEVIISPNPVEDRATFKVSQGNHNLTEIKIYDLIGKEVFTVNVSAGNGVYHADLGSLRAGVYFCTIFSDKGVVETRKLVRTTK